MAFPVPAERDDTLQSVDLARFLGYYLAEGSVSNYNARPLEQINFSLNFNEKEIYRWFDVIADSAHEIIATSKIARDILMRHAPIDGARVSVIYYGVDEGFKPIEDKTVVDRAVARYKDGDFMS